MTHHPRKPSDEPSGEQSVPPDEAPPLHEEDRAAGTTPPPTGSTNFDVVGADKSSDAAREHKAADKAAARDNTPNDAETAGKRPAGPNED